MKYYDILGVTKSSSTDEIKKAYRKLAMQYHPDRHPGNKPAEEKFKEISEAYAVISDDTKRKQYDMHGDAGFGRQAGYEDIYRNVDFGSIFKDMGFGGFDFESYFGAEQGGAGRRGAQRRSGYQQGFEPTYYDIEHELDVGFMDVYNGAERQLNLSLSTGEKISARIKIPGSIEDGRKLRLKEQGASRPDGKRGDLYLKIRMMPHPEFTRKEFDVEVDAEVPFTARCLGGSIDVPTPQGIKRTKIKPGMRNGVKVRLKGLGFLKGPAGERGDLYAKLSVKVPEELHLTPDVREVLEKLAVLGY